MSLTEQTIQALRRLEEVVLEALRQHGISRHALGEKYLDGITGETVRRKLVPDRPEGEAPPDITLCFRALEVCEMDGMEVLSSLCPAGSPEVLLSILPIPGFDLQAERKAERTKGYQRRRRLLRKVEKLEAAIPQGDPIAKKIWPVRRTDPELGPVYEELENLEEERRRDREIVEKICEEELARTCDSLSFADAVRRVGMLGIWGSIQRSARRRHFARDCLARSIALARRLGDVSLLPSQLQRSAGLFEECGVPSVAESILKDAVAQCLSDQNPDGVGYALVYSAAIAFNTGDIDLAQRRYFAASGQLTPSASPFYRIMIAQGVATCRVHEGDLHGALAFLESIGSSGEPYDHPHLRAAIHLTSGNIQRRLCQLAAAERSYREALRNLAGLNDYRSELKVYLDLSVCMAKAGNREGWQEAAAQVHLILPKLENQGDLQTQCELLLRELRSEQINIKALEKIRERIEERAVQRIAPR